MILALFKSVHGVGASLVAQHRRRVLYPHSPFGLVAHLLATHKGAQTVSGPLPSLVLRTEDMWPRYNQCIEVGGALNPGFPFSPLKKETYDGPACR